MGKKRKKSKKEKQQQKKNEEEIKSFVLISLPGCMNDIDFRIGREKENFIENVVFI